MRIIKKSTNKQTNDEKTRFGLKSLILGIGRLEGNDGDKNHYYFLA